MVTSLTRSEQPLKGNAPHGISMRRGPYIFMQRSLKAPTNADNADCAEARNGRESRRDDDGARPNSRETNTSGRRYSNTRVRGWNTGGRLRKPKLRSPVKSWAPWPPRTGAPPK